MWLVVLLCLIGTIGTQEPHLCKTPNQWEAAVHNSNYKVDAHLQAVLSYDSVSQRTRVLQKTRIGQTETYYDIITLYQSKAIFYVNMSTGNCSRYAFDEPWTDYGVDPNNKFLGEAYIGSPAVAGANVLTTIWSGNQSIPINDTAPFIAIWTYEKCLPVSRTLFAPYGNTNYLRYYNITLGINNTNVFVPPPQCPHEKTYPLSRPLVFNHELHMFGVSI